MRPSPPSRLLPLALGAALLSACSSSPVRDAPTVDTADSATAAPTGAIIDDSWPVSTQRYRTTSAAIYLGNLDSRIDMLQQRIDTPKSTPGDAAKLAGALYQRYRIRGRLDDAETALALLEGPITHSADSHLLHGVLLAGFHRFDEAIAALDAARAAGASERTLRADANDLAVAQGRYAELKDDFEQSLYPVADFAELAHRADLRMLLGDVDGAEMQYRAAQMLYRDVDPMPLAWLHTQAGIAMLRAGRIDDAHRFFAAAVERLPGYALAEEHLAECETLLGRHEQARERYRRVIAQTGNPEFIAALAGLERDTGNTAEADRLQQQAEDVYGSLLARHPTAFAQHAAEFFLDIGKPARALALARDNAALRRDIGSLILLARSAEAAGDAEAACAAGSAAGALNLSPPELADIRSLQRSCRQPG